MHQRGLPDAGAADDADELSRTNFEVEPFEDWFGILIAKLHISEAYLAFDLPETQGTRMFDIRRGRIENLKDAFGCRERLCHPAIHLAEPLEGAIEEEDIT